MHRLLLPILAALLIGAPGVAQAQFTGSPQEVIASGTSYHMFHYPGEPTVTVQLLGDLGGSGMYVVGENTSLTQFLVLAGGAPIGDPSANIRRTITVRVFREAGGMREPVYEERLQTLLAEPGGHPALRDGDLVTVEVELRERFNFMRTVQITSAISSLALLFIRLADWL